jgi:hypothetical protein
VNRTLLAFLAIVPLALVVAIVAEALDLGSWATTGLLMLGGIIVSLIDREGFYGISPRER